MAVEVAHDKVWDLLSQVAGSEAFLHCVCVIVWGCSRGEVESCHVELSSWGGDLGSEEAPWDVLNGSCAQRFVDEEGDTRSSSLSIIVR